MIGSTARSSMTSRSQYRKMSAGNPQYSEMELISTVLVGTTPITIASFDVSSLTNSYRHLQMRIVGRSDRAVQVEYARLRFNGDIGANYADHQLLGNGVSVLSASSLSSTFINIVRFTDSASTASTYGAAIVDMLDVFSSTKNKTTREIGGLATNPYSEIYLKSGLWLNTSVVTSVSLAPGGGTNWTAGTRISLYGVK